MPREQPPQPNLTPRAQAEADARRAREAAALRENLRRRKLQARAREDDSEPQAPPPGAPPENIG
jgi:hypothetical protein